MTIGLILHIGYVSEIPWIMDQFKAVEQHPEFTIVTILDQDFRDPTATQAIQQAVQFFFNMASHPNFACRKSGI